MKKIIQAFFVSFQFYHHAGRKGTDIVFLILQGSCTRKVRLRYDCLTPIFNFAWQPDARAYRFTESYYSTCSVIKFVSPLQAVPETFSRKRLQKGRMQCNQ